MDVDVAVRWPRWFQFSQGHQINFSISRPLSCVLFFSLIILHIYIYIYIDNEIEDALDDDLCEAMKLVLLSPNILVQVPPPPLPSFIICN